MPIDIAFLIHEREAQLNQIQGELNLLRLMLSNQITLHAPEIASLAQVPDSPVPIPTSQNEPQPIESNT